MQIRAVDASGNAAPVTVSIKVEEQTIIGNRYALLVGIDDYDNPNINDLTACTNDVKQLATVLAEASRGGFEVKKLVSNKTPKKEDDPTCANAILLLEEIVKQTKPKDLLLFYFSGHGYYSEDTNKSYLLTQEANARVLDKTALSSDDLNSILNTAKAKKIITIFDACHAGGVTLDKAVGEEGLPKTYYESFASAEGRWTLYSCKEKEKSYLLENRKNSVFSKYLIDGLKGVANQNRDEIITMSELYGYVFQKVKEHFLNDSARQQTPVSDSRISGTIPVVIDPQRKAEYQLETQIDKVYDLLKDYPVVVSRTVSLLKKRAQNQSLTENEQTLVKFLDSFLVGDISLIDYLGADKRFGQKQ